ncbi:hypothetical protein [Jeongeupia chitinilytica]|uniref:Uncharacterized protein n=1 Tax=Jeongeupia chitinilytica TaxID=1041641 RepID=A0ABQ3GY50_9NEIS|nr:hypothetical protein [Jeongeupia chitinilytica]GHD56934.1 hypothetical protein GCM10007350_04860 [Jeongeupia chitinilytica]
MKHRALVMAVVFAFQPVLASASASFDPHSVVGSDSSYAKSTLKSSGYQQVHEQAGTDRRWVSWWNSNSEDCVVTTEKNDRYIDAIGTVQAECKQYVKSAGVSGVALAAGAAALIGGIALYQHNKHKQKDEEKQHKDEQYQRGYTDGRNHDGRHNIDRSDDYNAGYDAGLAEYREQRGRDDDDRRDHHGRHRQDFVAVADLIGARASSGESQLIQRGFYNVDGRKGWHNSYTSWWNEAARECVQVVTNDGRYRDVRVVSPNNCA